MRAWRSCTTIIDSASRHQPGQVSFDQIAEAFQVTWPEGNSG